MLKRLGLLLLVAVTFASCIYVSPGRGSYTKIDKTVPALGLITVTKKRTKNKQPYVDTFTYSLEEVFEYMIPHTTGEKRNAKIAEI
jgi:hypothetical protein